ncbi:hypothetical protein BKA93DRAFT_774928 [Sparassis latifolia]
MHPRRTEILPFERRLLTGTRIGLFACSNGDTSPPFAVRWLVKHGAKKTRTRRSARHDGTTYRVKKELVENSLCRLTRMRSQVSDYAGEHHRLGVVHSFNRIERQIKLDHPPRAWDHMSEGGPPSRTSWRPQQHGESGAWEMRAGEMFSMCDQQRSAGSHRST